MLYNVSELINKLTEIKNDGYTLVEIDILEDDDNNNKEFMTFDAIVSPGYAIDYESVDSVGDFLDL